MAPSLQKKAHNSLDEVKDGEYKRTDSIYRDHISSGMFLASTFLWNIIKMIAYMFLFSAHTFDW
jgi:hypothetical protein